MQINNDLNTPVIVHAVRQDWVPSPSAPGDGTHPGCLRGLHDLRPPLAVCARRITRRSSAAPASEWLEPRDGAQNARLLFADEAEREVLEEWAHGAAVTVENARGLEFLVVAGGFATQGETLEPQSWGRLPAGQALEARVGPDGAAVWMRDAPLRHRDILDMPG